MDPPDPPQRKYSPLRVVVDTNVFPATKTWLLPLIEAAERRYVELYWSPWIISETNRLLTWLWLERNGSDQSDASWNRCSESAKRLFTRLTRVFRVQDDHPPYEKLWSEIPPDEWDVPIWTAGVRVGADFVVTRNLSDAPPQNADGVREYEGIVYCDPDTLLEVINLYADMIEAEGLPEIPEGVVLPQPMSARRLLARKLLQIASPWKRR